MQKMFTRITLIILGLIVFSLSAHSIENTLHSIEISKSFDGYHLLLRTDKLTHSSKKIESENKIYFELDNIKPEANLKTTYKNTGNIDGVVIQQNGNKIRIYLNAKDAKESALTFETPTQTVVLKNQKETKNNMPTFIFFGFIAGIFLMFKKLLSKIKHESEYGYANKLLKQDRIEYVKNYPNNNNTNMTNPYSRGVITIKSIERNRELYAKRKSA